MKETNKQTNKHSKIESGGGRLPKKKTGLYIPNLSNSLEQTEMRVPRIILKPQSPLMLLCSCHDFILYFSSLP